MDAVVTKIQRYSIYDGPGIRTTVFLKGCPLRCLWCHNPETQNPEPELMYDETSTATSVGDTYSVETLMPLILRDAPFFAETAGGVTFSGGEPLCRAEFVADCLSYCVRNGVHTAVDTTGFVSRKTLELVQPDLFLYDLKAANDAKHRKLTGVSNTEIFENLKFLMELGVSVEVRMPLVAGLNDSDEDIAAACDALNACGAPNVKLLPYHNIGAYKYERLGRQYLLVNASAPSSERLLEIARKLYDSGINVLNDNASML